MYAGHTAPFIIYIFTVYICLFLSSNAMKYRFGLKVQFLQQLMNRAQTALGMTHTPVHLLTGNDDSKKKNQLQDFQKDLRNKPVETSESGSEFRVLAYLKVLIFFKKPGFGHYCAVLPTDKT